MVSLIINEAGTGLPADFGYPAEDLLVTAGMYSGIAGVLSGK
jgi:hypothetical protein